MLGRALQWIGFGGDGHGHAHHDDHHHAHGHAHGTIDPSIASTERGIRAVKWSFVILAVTAALQFAIVMASGSVALLADTIHNLGDASTAVPLWIAFTLARRRPDARFTYGYGRVEDLAGAAIVGIILFSAIVAGYEAIDRLLHPQTVTHLFWVTSAGIVGFVGNEAVAVFRIRVGRQIESAALIADGYHARTDGLTSLAVVVGAAGIWLGYPLADPVIGLTIMLAILGIVWQSGRAVFMRMLDGVEPDTIAEIRHAAEHVSGVEHVVETKARWAGHRLHADLTIAVDENMMLGAANDIAASLRRELFAHLPALAVANIAFAAGGRGGGLPDTDR
jgi:cation diffusion facilitator family transporter